MSKQSKPGQQPIGLPLTISVLLHAGLLGLLAVSVDFASKPKPQPQASAPVVQAVAVDKAQVEQHVERIRAQEAAAREAERQRQAELDRQAKEAERKRQAEQERLRKLEQERQQRQAEIKKAEEAAKLAKIKQQEEEQRARQAAEKAAKEEAARQEAERKRKAEEEAARKAEAERKRKEEERKRKEAEEAARKAREEDLAAQMAAEQAELAAVRQQQVLSEVDRYSVLIQQAIKRNLREDRSMRGKECRVRLMLAPDGFVISQSVISGDAQVCRATEAAIRAAGNLPVSAEPDVYQQMKDLTITFKPEL
ncbi:cell envelope integrity protein TolA [Ferrimonas balearica]|uniref:cell envelope integrity protein TolA n=1 Tax=Ferrimonas balearica TaxID=44012 RepID=UPI001C99795F|nr:cell envelope integrity protein TolA [Ferrimonas balearica]MBY5920044.1 cell envelope integrity protein TolA [Ferrimonas balearica]MBY5997271.1 cell envelope integrity protein TolA [Ferrimonas balearica]